MPRLHRQGGRVPEEAPVGVARELLDPARGICRERCSAQACRDCLWTPSARAPDHMRRGCVNGGLQQTGVGRQPKAYRSSRLALEGSPALGGRFVRGVPPSSIPASSYSSLDEYASLEVPSSSLKVRISMPTSIRARPSPAAIRARQECRRTLLDDFLVRRFSDTRIVSRTWRSGLTRAVSGHPKTHRFADVAVRAYACSVRTPQNATFRGRDSPGLRVQCPDDPKRNVSRTWWLSSTYHM
jgi:hypothetical protein